jgi:cystathionine beta-lyase/cystathionine gamma-synthase
MKRSKQLSAGNDYDEGGGDSMKKETAILHGAAGRDEETGALSTPIYHASTFHQSDLDAPRWMYGRAGNPTRHVLEEQLAHLEGAVAGFAFASGMAALTAALTAWTQAGDHIVAPRDIYGGTYRLLTDYLAKFGLRHTFVDMTDPVATEKAVEKSTKILFIETPSNPLLRVTDLVAMAGLARRHGLISIIDNTFMTPLLQRPLDLGIDVSVHSATKFLGGHSDLIAGAVMTRSLELGQGVQAVQHTCGAMLSPGDSWLLLRGIKTLAARMEIQTRSAAALANWLKQQPWLREVYYPGLPDHPGHTVFKQQTTGFGAVLSFKADSEARAVRIMRNVALWNVAVSLGGVESILSYPKKMSHAAIPQKEREALGITGDLIRLSVGLENVEDLIGDLDHAANLA